MICFNSLLCRAVVIKLVAIKEILRSPHKFGFAEKNTCGRDETWQNPGTFTIENKYVAWSLNLIAKNKAIGKPTMTEGHYVFETGISVNAFEIIFISNYTINESK